MQTWKLVLLQEGSRTGRRSAERKKQSGGERAERCQWQIQRGEGVAAVEKIEVKREPEDFFGNRNRMSQPTWLFRRKATPLASTRINYWIFDLLEF